MLSPDSLLDFCVLEYPFALNQWGTEVMDVDENTTDEELFAHLMKVAGPDYFVVPSTTPFSFRRPGSSVITATTPLTCRICS